MTRSLLFFLVMALTAASFPGIVHAAAVDCEKVMEIDKRETFRAEPSDVRECVMRGWDPPVEWRNNGGKSAGVRADGSGGFSYGTVQAPEASPGSRNAPASVSKKVITSTCNFKARVKMGFPPKVELPKGSCLDFLKNIFRDKDGALNSDPTPPGNSNTTCPAETDTAGIYGQKQNILESKEIPTPCGAAMPLTTARTTLNKLPQEKMTNYAFTLNDSNTLFYYKKTGNDFIAYTTPPNPYDPTRVNFHGYSTGALRLPSFLCKTVTDGDSNTYRQKTVDLTRTLHQTFVYGNNESALYIRLKPRQTMDVGFIPPYDSTKPEMYLRIPILNGVPQVPEECADEDYFAPLSTYGNDIIIQPPEGPRCEPPDLHGNPENRPKKECAVGELSGDKCIDPLTGAVVGVPKLVDHWVFVCPSGTIITPPDPCPEEPGFPSLTCPEDDDSECETATIYPMGGSCSGKVQYAVLNHPNLFYPVGTTGKFYKTITTPADRTNYTQVLAEAAPGSLLYMLPETRVLLQSNAPETVFSDGGSFKIIPPSEELKVNPNESTLIVNAPGKVDPTTRRITLVNGGKLVSSSGMEAASYGNGATFTLPGSGMIILTTGRSISLPEGFLYPSTPSNNPKESEAYNKPYLRMPIDNPK